jgi:putative GTP pyrophosphokinase
MSSLGFDHEQSEFRKYYEGNRDTLDGAMESFQTLIRSLLAGGELAHATVVGRIKDR